MNQPWIKSHRFPVKGVAIADRHYNRQKVGSPQFVPPGSCVVYRLAEGSGLWVTSYPKAEFTKHAWAGAWVNTLFRNESPDLHLSSELITAAVAATLAEWPTPPDLGIVSFVDADKTRRKRDPGRCYRKAGWEHVGFTKQAHLYVFQLLPEAMPEPNSASGSISPLFPT